MIEVFVCTILMGVSFIIGRMSAPGYKRAESLKQNIAGLEAKARVLEVVNTVLKAAAEDYRYKYYRKLWGLDKQSLR